MTCPRQGGMSKVTSLHLLKTCYAHCYSFHQTLKRFIFLLLSLLFRLCTFVFPRLSGLHFSQSHHHSLSPTKLELLLFFHPRLYLLGPLGSKMLIIVVYAILRNSYIVYLFTIICHHLC